MNERDHTNDDVSDEHQRAIDTLAAVSAHQHRARRAARTPWWIYLATFVLIVGVGAANDVVDISATTLIAGAILVALVVVLATTFARKDTSSLLGRWRGVQPRQQFVPWVFGVMLVVFGAVMWWLTHDDVAPSIASAVDLSAYPNTVAGVLYGLVFTALLGLSRLLTAVAMRGSAR